MSDIDPAVMKLGQESYPLCMACHGPNGEGVPNLGPPLAGSEWVLGPKENLIRMQFRGLMGPITVKGEEWNLVMAPNAPMLQTDEKIAAVLTYIRNSWGNEASLVTAEEVAPFRSEMGQPMLTVADMIDPNSAPKEEAAPAKPAEKAPEEAPAPAPKKETSQAPAEKKAPVQEAKAEPAAPKVDVIDPAAQKIADQLTAEVGKAEDAPVKLEDYPQGISLGGMGFGLWMVICLVPVLIGFANRNND